MNYYTEAFKKYADFKGRASRAEYWYFILFNILISMGLGAIEGILGMKQYHRVNIQKSSELSRLYQMRRIQLFQQFYRQ